MSSINLTNQASMASCMASNAVAWKQRSILNPCATSLINLATHNFLHSNSVLFWYFLICQSATVLGQYVCGFLMAPVDGNFFFKGTAGNCIMRGLSCTFMGRQLSLNSPCRLLCGCGQCGKGVVFPVTLTFSGYALSRLYR